MRIYYTLTGAAPRGAWLLPGRGGEGSAAAWSLLLWALRRERGLDALPETALLPGGKPYFPGRPDICFSLSHTAGAALCALGGSPLGADVQRVREKDLAFAARLMSPRERGDFAFHELWCLRESVYKLCGEGSLRSMPFRREGGRIIAPAPGAQARLYADIPGCACAAAAYAGEAFPPRCEAVPAAELQKCVVV